MEELALEALRERFRPFDIRHNPDKYHLDYPPGMFRKASVLIPLFYRDGDYRVILTVRSKDLTHHAGYVAFPGGMADDDDEDEIHTALREAEEEIGLDPKLVDVVCFSGPGFVRPNTLAYVVIALVHPGFKLTRNEKEVEIVFDLPVSRFLSSDRLLVKHFKGPVGMIYHTHHFMDTVAKSEMNTVHERAEMDTVHERAETDTVHEREVDTWGFTAAFCIATALVLYQSDKKFVIVNDAEMTKDRAFSVDHTQWIIKQFTSVQSKV